MDSRVEKIKMPHRATFRGDGSKHYIKIAKRPDKVAGIVQWSLREMYGLSHLDGINIRLNQC